MRETDPKVSVIVPCYNQGQYLHDAVESVLAQTYSNWEIIVIDDGSTQPQTIDILNNYTAPKTTIIKTSNQGPSAARNHGIRAASGKYILPLDADDKIANFYLEKAVPILEQNDNIGIVYGQAEFFGAKSGRWRLPNYSFPEILLGNLIFNSSVYRKSDWEKVEGYNISMVNGW